MRRLSLSLLIVICLSGFLLGCSPQSPVAKPSEQELPFGKVTKYGLFRELGRGWIQDDPSASTGKIIRGATLEFVEDTDRIPLRKGVQFGYRYWLKFPSDQNQIGLRRVLIHPEMTLPDGSKVTQSERKISMRATHGIVTSIDAYALSEDYELVEGEWIFQIWHKGKMLAEQQFVAYWPEEEAPDKL